MIIENLFCYLGEDSHKTQHILSGSFMGLYSHDSSLQHLISNLAICFLQVVLHEVKPPATAYE